MIAPPRAAGAVPLSSVALNVARPLCAEKPHKYRSNISQNPLVLGRLLACIFIIIYEKGGTYDVSAVIRYAVARSAPSSLTADKIYREYAEARILVSLFARHAELQVSC
jgi:hypothetical protein